MKRIELPVRGMDCASCAAHVRGALQSVEGVTSAEVLVGAGKALVEFDEGKVDLSRLVAAVASVGYSVPAAARPSGARSARHPTWRASPAARFAPRGCCSVPSS